MNSRTVKCFHCEKLLFYKEAIIAFLDEHLKKDILICEKCCDSYTYEHKGVRVFVWENMKM